MADKSARDYERLKEINLCLSLLGLVRKLNLLVLHFKKVYIHLSCTVDGGRASILNPENMSTKEKCRDK